MITDNWNYNMDEAPRGHTEKRERKNNKGEDVIVDVFVPDLIIACSKDGETVTISRWLPEEKRWNMFATNEDPLAWQPWPDHPNAK